LKKWKKIKWQKSSGNQPINVDLENDHRNNVCWTYNKWSLTSAHNARRLTNQEQTRLYEPGRLPWKTHRISNISHQTSSFLEISSILCFIWSFWRRFLRCISLSRAARFVANSLVACTYHKHIQISIKIIADLQNKYRAFIACRLDLCNSLLYGVPENLLRKVQSVQNAAAHLLTSARRCDHITPVMCQLHCLPVQRQVEFKLACFVHQLLASLAPTYLTADIHVVSRVWSLPPALI